MIVSLGIHDPIDPSFFFADGQALQDGQTRTVFFGLLKSVFSDEDLFVANLEQLNEKNAQENCLAVVLLPVQLNFFFNDPLEGLEDFLILLVHLVFQLLGGRNLTLIAFSRPETILIVFSLSLLLACYHFSLNFFL